MGAPTVQGSSVVAAALTTASVTPTLPAHQANDILLSPAWIRTSTGGLSVPTGWTSFADFTRGTTARYRAAWKRAAGSAETNPTWAVSGGATADKFAQVHVIRGCVTGGQSFQAGSLGSGTGTADPATNAGVTPPIRRTSSSGGCSLSRGRSPSR